MERELLCEAPLFEDIELQEITEGEDNGLKLLTIKGTASRGDMFNKNKRMYPTKVLKTVAEKSQSSLKKGKMTGQLDHPSFFGGAGDLERTAIKFTNLWMEGNDLKFEANVIPTTPGRELAALLKSKVGIGMSTRGYGTLLPFKNKNGKEDKEKLVVQDDYELFGVDAVLNESNQYSKVAHFEHKEGGNTVDELDLKTLKSDHSELYEEVKSELSADLEKDFDAKVEAAVSEKLDAQKEAIKAEVMDSDEVKGMREFINTVVELSKPHVPGQQEYEETEKQKEIDALTEKLAKAEADKATAVSESDALKAEKDAHEQKQKVKDYVVDKVKGHRFADQLTKKLSECASAEEVDSKFDEEVAYIESLGTIEVPKGTGVTKTSEEDDKTTKLDEQKERERKLAGINEKGGK